MMLRIQPLKVFSSFLFAKTGLARINLAYAEPMHKPAGWHSSNQGRVKVVGNTVLLMPDM